MKQLTIPTLSINQISRGSENGRKVSLQVLAQSICIALTSYPHFIVVKGFPPLKDPTNLINVSGAIYSISLKQSVLGFNSQESMKLSFTEVKVDRSQPIVKGKVTQYSRTHLPIAPHTDSSYKPKPHELVAFQCIVADKMGGESIIIPVEDILSRIDSKKVELLRDAVFPFGKNLYPIISGETGNELIRYYRTQIDQILKTTTFSLSDQHRAAIDTLDAVLEQTAQWIHFSLQPGEIIFMHNRKVLHGRTGFSPESNRLLYRVRLQLASLESGNLSP